MTQQLAIKLPPQRKTTSFGLPRHKMAATHGCDSTGATEPPTIRICFRRERRPHALVTAGGDTKTLVDVHARAQLRGRSLPGGVVRGG